jgi:hypothetical protein
MTLTEAERERITEKYVVTPDGCWRWTGSFDKDGYGRFQVGPRAKLAHRVMLAAVGRDVPDGMEVDHLCRNRSCVNPDHLEPVTHIENCVRAYHARKACKNGHELTPENTRLEWRTPQGLPWRACRACDRVASAKYAAKRRAAAS